MMLGGSNKEVHLWTADGVQIGQICTKGGWVWACRARPNQSEVAVASADGTVSVHQIQFNNVHALYNDRYAYRQNMTDVIVQNLVTNQKSKIRCKDYIQKISIYKEYIAVQLPGKILIYESIYDEHGEVIYRIKERVLKILDCTMLVVTGKNILLCSQTKVEMISFSGDTIHEWNFDAIIRFMKVVEGPKGREGVLLGLKDGHAFKIFVDNPFPILLVKHKFPVKCLDINLSRKKVAIVDDENTCSVYDIRTGELLYQEPEIQSVSWNIEIEDSICFSGINGLLVKTDQFVCYQQKSSGFVVGFKGSRVFSLNNYAMSFIDVPQSAALEGFMEKGDYENAYKVACSGIPESDWKKLALASMEQLSLDVAKKSFARIRDFKYLEAIRVIEKMKQDGRRETDLFQAEVSAYCENYAEVY